MSSCSRRHRGIVKKHGRLCHLIVFVNMWHEFVEVFLEVNMSSYPPMVGVQRKAMLRIVQKSRVQQRLVHILCVLISGINTCTKRCTQPGQDDMYRFGVQHEAIHSFTSRKRVDGIIYCQRQREHCEMQKMSCLNSLFQTTSSFTCRSRV